MKNREKLHPGWQLQWEASKQMKGAKDIQLAGGISTLSFQNRVGCFPVGLFMVGVEKGWFQFKPKMAPAETRKRNLCPAILLYSLHMCIYLQKLLLQQASI